MDFFPNPKTFLSIGPLSIQWYAVLIIIGIGVAYYFSKKDFKENGYSQDTLDDLLIGCLICGIVCARLWFCLFWDAQYYFSDITHLLDIRGGGLAIQGGLIGGSLYGLYYAKKHKMSFLRSSDVVATNILISQAIGRWGNFINQEAYGRIVNEAYFNWAPDFIKQGMYIGGEYRQPTFLWESVLDLLGFIVLRYGYKKHGHGKRGDITCLYLMWYGVSRFIVESFRTDNLMFLGMRMSRLMALIFIVVGACGLIYIRFKKKPAKPIVLFDLDGTLLDTKPAIMATYRHLFEKYDKVENFTEAVQVEVQGPPLTEMFAKYFPNVDQEQLLKEYREYNFAVHEKLVKPMPNCEMMLKELKENGYQIGIVSTKYTEAINFGLDMFDLTRYFDVILGKDKVSKTKPDPAGLYEACTALNKGHDSCIYVGDSKGDMQASKAAGMYTIAYVGNDETRTQAVVEEKPNAVITDLKDIIDIVKEDHEWTYNMM